MLCNIYIYIHIYIYIEITLCYIYLYLWQDGEEEEPREADTCVDEEPKILKKPSNKIRKKPAKKIRKKESKMLREKTAQKDTEKVLSEVQDSTGNTSPEPRGSGDTVIQEISMLPFLFNSSLVYLWQDGEEENGEKESGVDEEPANKIRINPKN